ACLLVGILPARTVGPMLETAAVSILGPELPEYRLVVWHGFTIPLLMSVAALSGGVAFYLMLYRRRKTLIPTPLLSRFDSKRMFDVANVLATRGASRIGRTLFSRRLQTQLLLIVGFAIG